MNYRSLLDQVMRTLDEVDIADRSESSIREVAETIASNFREELGIKGGRIFRWEGTSYELVGRFGTHGKGALGIVISASYAPIRELLEKGILVMDRNDPAADPNLEKKLGAKRFAAIVVGDDDFIISFDITTDTPREDIFQALAIVRHAINQKLRVNRFESMIREAQRIQQSILPTTSPQFEGFDIHGRTVAAEHVAGDYFGYLRLSPKSLGLAVADATGHGLPAALVVRDIHMGLRMGADRDFKIVRTVEKLNRIIHESGISTKFVSLVYAELEASGTLVYANAGHPAPLLINGSRVEWLTSGGPVLGPTPDASYTRGYVNIEPGGVLCLYSDGIVEATNAKGEELGQERLERMLESLRNEDAETIVTTILEKVDEWDRGEPDDRTVVIIRRT
ncbi:MAG: PP2C family protein-serine/threonine phosphatase [Acidobacteria bacterium]|nr:PP2C family protein-serine/threonine phosphatase [Acidobacteriota bacterium]